MSSVAFRICVQKADTKDDMLSITPSGMSYKVTFAQASLDDVSTTTLKMSGLISYIELFMDSILADNNGCACIQIDCPSFPSVILYKDAIMKYMPILRLQLHSIMENWPAGYTVQ